MTVVKYVAGECPTNGYALVDFETRKAAIEPAYVRPDTGEVMRKRWQIFAAGVAVREQIWVLHSDDETALLAEVGDLLEGSEAVIYCATREFDEMLAKGRFTNARRAHLPASGPWPSVPGASEMEWVNVRRVAGSVTRVAADDDLPSRDVPEAWRRGERERVLAHLVADIRWLSEVCENEVVPSHMVG